MTTLQAARALRSARSWVEKVLRDVEFPRDDRIELLNAVNVLLQREGEIMARWAAERTETAA